MTSPALHLLRRWLIGLLAGLLALGPFLHSHVGVSHDTGFHLDGVHAVHAAQGASFSALEAPGEESPALSVAVSLPHAEDEGWTLPELTAALLLAWLSLLLARPPLPRLGAAIVLSGAPRYRPGLPPPSLAPPRA